MLPRNSLNLGAGEHFTNAEDDHGQDGVSDAIGRPEAGESDDDEDGAHQHAVGGAHFGAQAGKQEAGEHDHAGVDVDDALGLNGLPVGVHAKQKFPNPAVRAACPEKECHHGRSVHPIFNVFG